MNEIRNNLTIHISNHYLCQKCYSFEYVMKSFKNVNQKWIECDENEAEIAMEYCTECNCDERVHENYFLDDSYKDRKRPYIHRFWKRVKNGWEGCKDNENILLYNKIYYNIK